MRAPFFLYSLVALAGIATALRGPAAIADDKPPETRRTISVTGQGEVSASPDVAILSVAVETTAVKAADAVNENASRSAKVSQREPVWINPDGSRCSPSGLVDCH